MDVLVQDGEVRQMVDQLSFLTGETEGDAIRYAVKERLERLVANDRATYLARLRAITSRVAAMPILDARDADEILGYNEDGLFD